VAGFIAFVTCPEPPTAQYNPESPPGHMAVREGVFLWEGHFFSRGGRMPSGL